MENERTNYTNRTDEAVNKIYNKRNKLKTAKRYQRNLRSDEISAKKQSFLVILAIVLFVTFSGLLGTIDPPASREQVSTPQGSSTYIQEISPQAGEIATGSIQVFLNIFIPIAKAVEWLVTGFGDIVRAIVNSIIVLGASVGLGDDPACLTIDSLSIVDAWSFEISWSWHRITILATEFNPDVLQAERLSYFENVWLPDNYASTVVCS